MDPTAAPTSWECGPGEVLVRNRTGVTQVLANAGVTLYPGQWSPLAREFAYKLRAALVVDLYLPEDPSTYLWRDDRGYHVYWMSPFSLGDGYGTGAEHTINNAIDLGLNAKLQACWFLEERGILLRTLESIKAPAESAYLVGICMATPGEFKKLPTPYKIGFTMYESTNPLATHPEWRPECNAVDRLFVPSPWCKQLFGGLLREDLPIDVVPLVVNPLYCVTRERKPRDTFTFISFATSLTDRKGAVEASDLFVKAFPRKRYPHVRLKLKTKLSDGFTVMVNYKLSELKDDRISIITGAWLQERMLEFMLDSDAMLFLSFGEGFGLPPREALATGMPVILPNHTGMAEVCDAQYNWPVPTKRVVSSPLGGDWFEPDYDIAVDMMRDIVDHPERAFAKARRGAEWFVGGNNARVLVDTVQDLSPVFDLQERAFQRAALRGEVLRVPRFILDELREVHRPLLDALGHVRGPMLEVGLGQGATHAEARLRGYDVQGIEINPEVLAACRENLREAYDLEIEAAVLDGFNLSHSALSRVGLKPGFAAIFSDGLLEHLHDKEIGLLVRAMLSVAPTVYFSVPSVYHPESWDGCRQLRREQWVDICSDQLLALQDITYYHAKHYLLGCIVGETSGARGAIQRHGYVRGGVWRPHPPRK
jgi:glycosyltransferase involved in cell wall biosynthesis